MKYSPSDNLILYVDEDILVINKPAGLPSLPDGYDPEADHVRTLLEPEYGPLWMVHRLDRQTSGVLLLARSEAAHRDLNAQFESRETAKVYHTLIAGNPNWEERQVSLALRPNADRKHRTTVDARYGQPALTNFRVVERFGIVTLLEAAPETGRTHQIRVHLKAIGFSILGDQLYGDGQPLYLSAIKPRYQPGRKAGRERVEQEFRRPETPILDRLALHALSVSLRHPGTQEPLTVEAPYPKDIALSLKQLRKYRAK